MSDFKTVVEYLGFDPEKVKTLEDLKPSFETDFLRVSTLKDRTDLIDPLVGKRMGSIQTELKRAAKEYAIDFDSEDFKGKKVEEQAKLLVHKMAENNLKTVTELQAKVGQGNDEKVKEWESKYEKLSKTLGEKESLLSETVGKYQDLEKTTSTKIKEIGINSKKSELIRQLMPSLNLGDDLLKVKGWDSTVNSYEYELDESGELEIRRDGKPIPSAKVTGTYMKPIEVLTEDAIKLNVYKLNQQGGNPAPKAQVIPNMQQQAQGTKTTFVNPRAQR